MATTYVYIVYLPPDPNALSVNPTGELLVLYDPPDAALSNLVNALGGSISKINAADFEPQSPPVVIATPTNSPPTSLPVTVTSPTQASAPAPTSSTPILVQLTNANNQSISINYSFKPVKITGGIGKVVLYGGFNELLKINSETGTTEQSWNLGNRRQLYISDVSPTNEVVFVSRVNDVSVSDIVYVIMADSSLKAIHTNRGFISCCGYSESYFYVVDSYGVVFSTYDYDPIKRNILQYDAITYNLISACSIYIHIYKDLIDFTTNDYIVTAGMTDHTNNVAPYYFTSTIYKYSVSGVLQWKCDLPVTDTIPNNYNYAQEVISLSVDKTNNEISVLTHILIQEDYDNFVDYYRLVRISNAGNVKWITTLSMNDEDTLYIVIKNSMVSWQGVTLLTLDVNKVIAIDENGTPLWSSVSLGGRPSVFSIDTGGIYVAHDNGITALNNMGQVLWNNTASIGLIEY